MRGRLTAAGSALLVIVSVAGPSLADAGLDRAKEAALALQQGRAVEAVQLFTEALAAPSLSNDRRAALLNDRGVAYSRSGRSKLAIEDFNASIRLAPEGASTYNNRGTVLIGLGMSGEAEKDFNRAIALAPGYAAAYVNRAHARLLAGEADEAMRDFSHAARLSPRAAAAYAGRGRLHLKANRPHAAVRDLNRAVKSDERFGAAYRLRAEAYTVLGKFDEAIADLSRAAAFDPGNSALYLARGYGYLAARNVASAIKDFQRASELAPREAATFEGLALAQSRAGGHDDALDSIARALEADPRSAQSYAYRAVVYKLLGQVDLAEKDLDRALRLDAARPEVKWARGEVLEALGRRDEAVAELRLALEGRPSLREAAFALERLGAIEERDVEVPGQALQGWRVFTRKGRSYAANDDLRGLQVPLETMSEGSVPQLVDYEVKGGEHAGLAILRFTAGTVDGASGREEVQHGAVIDLQLKAVLAVETLQQGSQSANWEWGEDALVVTGLDGFRQDYPFKGRAQRETAAAVPAAPRPAARQRPRPSDQAWVPWGGEPFWGGGGSSQQKGRRPQQQPKTLFQMLFGN